MLIEAAKGGHTNVVSYLLDYPTNILSVPAPDLSQLTPPSQDASQVPPPSFHGAGRARYSRTLLLTLLEGGGSADDVSLSLRVGSSCPIPSSGHGGASPGARQSPIKHRHASTRLQQR